MSSSAALIIHLPYSFQSKFVLNTFRYIHWNQTNPQFEEINQAANNLKIIRQMANNEWQGLRLQHLSGCLYLWRADEDTRGFKLGLWETVILSCSSLGHDYSYLELPWETQSVGSKGPDSSLRLQVKVPMFST